MVSGRYIHGDVESQEQPLPPSDIKGLPAGFVTNIFSIMKQKRKKERKGERGGI